MELMFSCNFLSHNFLSWNFLFMEFSSHEKCIHGTFIHEIFHHGIFFHEIFHSCNFVSWNFLSCNFPSCNFLVVRDDIDSIVCVCFIVLGKIWQVLPQYFCQSWKNVNSHFLQRKCWPLPSDLNLAIYILGRLDFGKFYQKSAQFQNFCSKTVYLASLIFLRI